MCGRPPGPSFFVGSEGTLGIVTEVIVKLIPLPRHRRAAMVGFGSLDDAGRAVARVLGAGFLPAALELMGRSALELVADQLPPGFEPVLEAVLVVEQDGADQQNVLAELDGITELLGGAETRIARTEAERLGIWKARRHIAEVLTERGRNYLSADLGVRVGAAAARIIRAAVALGGTVSAEHGLGALNRDFAETEHGGEALLLMRSLKQVLDPAGILNPRKIFPEGAADDDFLARQPGWA